MWEPVQITGALAQAITWEKWDDPLLWVFLPSLNWELVEYLHLEKEKEGKVLDSWVIKLKICLLSGSR